MPPLAVFDLDGTLVDTAPDLVDTANTVLAAHGVPPVPADILRPHIGLGARRMIEVSLAQAGRRMTADEISGLHRDFLAQYVGRIARFSRPFPEIAPALDALDAAGVALAICTNKREGMARQLMQELGLAHRFVVIAGADTFAAMKPDPAHLLETIRAAGGDPSRAVFVGDSRVDWQTARAAAVPFVGLTFGYSEVPLAELGADRLLAPGDDLAAAVLSLLRAEERVA